MFLTPFGAREASLSALFILKIHPTAIVAPGAQLGSNVEIGPYAVIDNGVTVGDDCMIQAHAILTDHVTLGARNLVGFGAVIGSAPQDFAHTQSVASSVDIGDDNSFREYVTIHRGTKEGTATRIGSKNLLMGGVHVGHNCIVGDRNVIANNCLLAGYVHLGDDTVLGGGSSFSPRPPHWGLGDDSRRHRLEQGRPTLHRR